MKARKIVKKEIEYYADCPHCKKEIKGSTQNQVKYNLDTHINAKHKGANKKS